MELSNTEDEYGLIAKIFHWSIAFLILGLLPVGLFMGGMENSPLKFEIFAMHKSFGLLVFFLGIGRIVWRFVSPPPEHLETHKRWEQVLASAAHGWLYVCIIGMPLSGWLMSSAAEFPIPFFGIQMPSLAGKNEGMAELYGEVHEILAYTLLFVLGLHIAGALKHHVIDKDETLGRMAWRSKILVPVLVVLIAGASYAASTFFAAKDILSEQEEEDGVVANVVTADPATMVSAPVLPSVLPDTATMAQHGWAIVPEKSKLQFQAVLYNAPFTGDMKDFKGTIVFNPDDLSTAYADIRIGMKDVVTGDADRDSNIQGPDWFDTAKYTEARFETVKFEKADGNNYVAVGNLTLHGVTMPLILPFTLDIVDKTAHVQGKASIDRTDFGIGMGEWEDGATVAKNVDIIIDLSAVQ